MLTRRRYLGLVAGLGATAGCSTEARSALNGSRLTAAPTETATQPRRTPGEGAVDVPTGSYAGVYRETIDSVVFVRTRTDTGSGGTGSGFVFGDDIVVTNDHVVDDATTVSVRFNRGEWQSATVVGTDPYSDLAALEVATPGYASPVSLGAEDPPVGTEVVAIGNPFGLDRSVSAGIVSGVDRAVRAPGRRYRIPDTIQTDAAVNPGNSGGPLLTLDGTAVGVVSVAGGENIAFAISAALARRVVPSLVATGSYEHPFLGVRLTAVTPVIAEANGIDRPRGVLVVGVLQDGPADGTLRPATDTELVDGVRAPVGGDVVLAVDGRPVQSPEAVLTLLALETSPGDTVPVTVLRDGDRQELTVELGRRPPPPAAGSSGL